MSEPADPPAEAFSGLSGSNTAAIVILILAASLSTLHLIMRPGLPVAHDMVFHLFQADQFHLAIASGSILPSWAMSANNGYGSPNFIFYAPLSYYFASLARLFAPSPVISLAVAIWSSFLFSGAAMYLAVKKISGVRGALFAAILYQLLPFHLLNLYGRGAFAELWAYGWFPLALLFMHALLSREQGPFSFAGLGLSYAALILTHLVSAFMFTHLLLLYMACHYYCRRSGKALLRGVSAMAVGLGISSFYLLPVIWERRYVQMGYMFNYTFSDFRHNFLFLKNAFDSSFLVALNGAALLEAILFLTIAMLLLKRDDERAVDPHQMALCIAFASAFLLAVPLSAPLWKYQPGLAILQFPWRWLSIAELSLCLLAGALFSQKGFSDLKNSDLTGRMALYTVAAVMSLSFLLILKSSDMHPTSLLARITDAEQVRRYTNLPKEYTPVWASDVEKIIATGDDSRISTLSGKAVLRILKWEPENRIIAVDATSAVLLRIATFYYPGWKAEIDGKKSDIAIEPKSGAMLVSVPTGEHKLRFSFVATPLRLVSIYISLGSCLLLTFPALVAARDKIWGSKGHQNA